MEPYLFTFIILLAIIEWANRKIRLWIKNN